MISPYVWDLFLVIFGMIVGAALADYWLSPRIGRRVFKAVKGEVSKYPSVIGLTNLFKNPGFEEFILNTIDSLETFNELMKKIKKEGIMGCLKK